MIERSSEIPKCHPHKFRATFATRLLHGGMDLKTVQKFLRSQEPRIDHALLEPRRIQQDESQG